MDFRRNELPDGCIQMVCTSPPYWGLRKYSGEQDLTWGGDKDCEHEWGIKERYLHRGTTKSPKLTDGMMTQASVSDGFCSLCGAWKGAYGLEPTPELYVQHTIEILREIRRVLRKDGVVFWNIGDSYYGGGFGTSPGGNEDFAQRYPKQASNKGTAEHEDRKLLGSLKKGHSTIKPKDLCLIPFRIAIAAQEDGWWVRSVIIWSKPNPMPESVTDRPTESHEYILMLTKSAKYYWDADAVREPQLPQSIGRMQRSHFTDYDLNYPTQGPQNLHFGQKLSEEEAEAMSGRNIRTVWEFPTQPYPEAHFAVFPEKLPELCIKAATPEVGCCSKCGIPWERIIENTPMKIRRTDWGKQAGNRTASSGTMIELNKSCTIGWQPTCECNADKVPSIVLDPFAGAGTTLWVAKKLNRKAIGFDISEEYSELVAKRNLQQVMV